MIYVGTIPTTGSNQNNRYTLSMRLEEPDRMIYTCTRMQVEGKTFETEIKFASHKPGDKIVDLKSFIV